MEFDRTESSYVANKIKENVTNLQLGEVKKVWEHTSHSDKNNFELNVTLRDEDKTRRKMPLLTGSNNKIEPPEVGDTVLVGFMDGSSEAPVVIGNIYNIDNRPPLGRAGMYRLKRGDKYLEVHEDGDWARISKKPDDDADPTSVMTIDDTGSKTTVRLKSEGNIDITAENSDVVINVPNGTVHLAGTGGEKVARDGTAIQTSDPLTGDNGGSIDGGTDNVKAN